VSQSANRNTLDQSPLASDSDALLFLKRTLQFHSADAEKSAVFEKLQSLQRALDAQESMLLTGPNSPGKDRIRESLTKAKALVASILVDLDVPREPPVVHGPETG